MAEYIERDMFLKIISHKPSSPTTDREDRLINGFISAVKNCPAADVRPVVRGTWAAIDDFPHDDWECDHCGCVVENTNDPWNYYHFCPNCGADMREES